MTDDQGQRAFGRSDRAAFYVASDGKCAICGDHLQQDWEADHILPWSKGGATTPANGRATCRTCNRRRSNRDAPDQTMGARRVPQRPSDRPLRVWQAEFTERIAQHAADSFLLHATPGAGKTVAAGSALLELWQPRGFERIIVVCPTTHLRSQWAEALSPWGLELDPHFGNGQPVIPDDMDGIAVTYAQVASLPGLFAKLTGQRSSAVVFDEVHHAGETAWWGRALVAAFHEAAFRLCLSGTPFRSDKAPIPFVSYDENGYARPDYSYGYAQSLVDGVCRPVEFELREAHAVWEYDGETREATFEHELSPVEVMSVEVV